MTHAHAGPYRTKTSRDHEPLKGFAHNADHGAKGADHSAHVNLAGADTVAANAEAEAREIAAVPDPQSPAGQAAILAIIQKYQAQSADTVEGAAVDEQANGAQAAGHHHHHDDDGGDDEGGRGGSGLMDILSQLLGSGGSSLQGMNPFGQGGMSPFGGQGMGQGANPFGDPYGVQQAGAAAPAANPFAQPPAPAAAAASYSPAADPFASPPARGAAAAAGPNIAANPYETGGQGAPGAQGPPGALPRGGAPGSRGSGVDADAFGGGDGGGVPADPAAGAAGATPRLAGVMATTAVNSAPVTSWWYGQGRAIDVVRRLESLHALSPSPGPAGIVTARRDELIVTFVEGLKSGLPQPWQPAGREARIAWEAVELADAPDPQHPVYLVVFGTTDDGALVALNLAAFSRVRIEGDADTAAALVSRWVLELLAIHPAITVGVTDDVWRGPWTTRVQPVTPGRVPDVDVLVCGGALTYADRAQIAATSTSPILLDLGRDAALSTTWVITCGPDRLGQISRGSASRPLSVTLIVPATEIVDRCAELLVAAAVNAAASPGPPSSPEMPEHDDEKIAPADRSTDTDAGLPGPDRPEPAPAAPSPAGPAADPARAGDAIDFFAPSQAPTTPGADPLATPASQTILAAESVADELSCQTTGYGQTGMAGDAIDATPSAGNTAVPAPGEVAPAREDVQHPVRNGAPVITAIWNRILGQVDLTPPHTTQQPGPREKRLNELTVYLQHHPWANSADIVRAIYSGAASEKTVTQQVSMLRARLGVVRPGGPKALPPMHEGCYHLDNAVRSDWMEFERLVEILVETTPTPQLIAAMDLITGPPLGGIAPKEWAWTQDLRDELRDRIPAAAVVLARRHHDTKSHLAAVQTARKGLWYDNARQDLWEIALQSTLDGHDKDGFRGLREQYLNTIAGPDRDPAVFDLTGRAG